MIILDTNVVAELMRTTPSEAVRAWVESARSEDLATTAVTVAEIRNGLERLPRGQRARRLGAVADQVLDAFADQVLPFDLSASEFYGRIVTARERAGRPIDALDAQIAAIARAHGADVATRNTKDFDGAGLRLINPWRA